MNVKVARNENKRFETILDETGSFASGSKIMKDTETGVLYLFHYSGYAGGFTLLVDREGKPLVDASTK